MNEQIMQIKQQMKGLSKSLICGEISKEEYQCMNKSLQGELARLLMIKNFIFSRRELKNV